jgi:F-type H+-transporting ATPase subunit epsilon
MQLELVTLRGKKLDQEIYEVTIPTENGPIAVYPSHQAHVTLAVPGALAIRHKKNDSDDQLEYLAITGGVVKVSHDRVRILVDEADHSDEILEEESKAALERAKEMQKNAKNQVELERAMELIDRHTVRLQVAGLRRRTRVK